MRFLTQICFFFLCVHTAIANPVINPTINPATNKAPCFDIKNANLQLDHIYLELSVQNLNINSLNSATNKLTNLTSLAEQCIDEAQKRLTNINLLIQQDADATTQNTTVVDKVYLGNEQKKAADEQAQYRLFIIRAKEAIEAYKTAIAKLNQEQTLKRSLPMWTVVKQLIQSPGLDNMNTFSQLPLDPVFSPVIWTIISSISFILSFFILKQTRKNHLAKHYLRIKKLRFSHIILLGAFFISGTAFAALSFELQDSNDPNLSLNLYGLAFAYLFAFMLVTFFFKIKRVRSFFYWYDLDFNYFRRIILYFTSFYTLSLLGQLLANAFEISNRIWELGHALFLLSMLAAELYFIFYFCRSHRHLRFIKNHHHLINRLGSVILFTCVFLALFGFYTLAMRLTLSGMTTFIVIFLTILLTHSINKAYLSLTESQHAHTKIIKYFGYKKNQTFTEFLILKTTMQFVIIAVGLYLIVRSWGFATYYLESMYTQFLYGIHIGNTIIYPTRIVAGVIVYCLMYLLFRSISTAISRHQQFEDEEETQVAIASILIYIGFALALLSALLVAGFNFTGLAIVAGALSVGIGLGLQSIVNNFVSGLILLIEKPIKAGDRINIDGVEGFVKQIRVRSTHIITPACEDIIVPNSDLITRRVTNYVYSNKQFSITCEINVPFGSNTKHVHDLLLTAALGHDEVIKTGRQKPYVLFRSFGEKALVFQLCCLIKDVNKKLMVQSDLNFAIDELLRDNIV